MLKKINYDYLYRAINLLLVSAIAYLLLFRFLHLTPYLINKHSWGESQYAMWAASYLKEGLFFGVKEVDYFKPLTNYIPLASIFAAALSDLFDTNLVFTGRVLSFLFTVLSVIYFKRVSKLVFKDDFKSLIATLIFVVLPISMYYTGMFYNDPIHLFFIVYITYLLLARRHKQQVAFYYYKIFICGVLILLTKPTTALILGMPTIYLFFIDYKSGELDKKEFLSLTVALLVSVIFFVVTRIIYDGYNVETGKLISKDVINDYQSYAKKAWGYFSFYFQNYIYIYIVAFFVSIFSSHHVRFFMFMSLGFILFFILFIKGALVHQYYSLPFLLPYSIIVSYGVFKSIGYFISNKLVFTVLVLLVVIAFSPDKKHLYYMFKPEYSRDLPYVVETVKRIKDVKNIYIMAHGHTSFQYYLDIPSSNVGYIWNQKQSVADILIDGDVDVVIVGNRNDYSTFISDVEKLGYQRYYCSDDYLIYRLNYEDGFVKNCSIKK
jgi:4-amino-4-deoxy-L-arabinose transferase-like glycosyltransferase